MEFLYGAALLVLAIALLGAARFIVIRLEGSSWVNRFAGTETMALIITTISAFGVAFLCAGLASDSGALGLTEFGAALGVIALAAVGVVRVFRAAGRSRTPAASADRGAAKRVA